MNPESESSGQQDELDSHIEILPTGVLPFPINPVNMDNAEHILVITDDEIEAALHPDFVVDEVDLIRSIVINEPINGTQIGLRPLIVKGEAEPNTELAIDCEGFHAIIKSDAEGCFAFKDVVAQIGWNEIEVSNLTYPGITAIIQIYRQEKPLLYIGRKDPYSQSVLTDNDQVVRCKKCKNFARLDTWQVLPGCAMRGCGSNQYLTSDDNDFYIDENEVEL